jgi:hypothetical protein
MRVGFMSLMLLRGLFIRLRGGIGCLFWVLIGLGAFPFVCKLRMFCISTRLLMYLSPCHQLDEQVILNTLNFFIEQLTEFS